MKFVRFGLFLTTGNHRLKRTGLLSSLPLPPKMNMTAYSEIAFRAAPAIAIGSGTVMMAFPGAVAYCALGAIGFGGAGVVGGKIECDD